VGCLSVATFVGVMEVLRNNICDLVDIDFDGCDCAYMIPVF
jgi:hypothetical protein